ncbi:hypothetical protein AMK59_1374 [Oryctes borbonicus]|uniref:DDE Tnp4 domain-containing protein n=1 Tax=Oryctes borbonicus TaxID=1629725 RepID=A0A0T6BBX8_9SCAR|nr:hypothetical protein AMK59_1374 [Oryctes borbonicus]
MNLYKFKRNMFTSNLFLYENSLLKFRLLKAKRRKWVAEENLQREELGEFIHLYENLRKDPNKFFEYCRMSIDCFDLLLNKIQHKLSKQTTACRRSISPTERLIVCLRYLATGTSFRSIALTFRMGISTVGMIVLETCAALWEELQSQYMPFPTQEHLQNVMHRFQMRYNFPNCFGAIGGMHCKIKCPANLVRSKYSKKHFSVVLQAVVDADHRFTFVEVGGGEDNDDTFTSSMLHTLLENNRFNVPNSTYLPNSTIQAPNVLVADAGFPLKTYLMRPYPRSNIVKGNEIFNHRISTATQCVDCAFRKLVKKWPIFTKQIDTNMDNGRTIIKAACMLHNFVIAIDENRNGTFDTTIVNYRQVGNKNKNATSAAKKVRLTFTEYFRNNPIINVDS